jgi:hypothetical protein
LCSYLYLLVQANQDAYLLSLFSQV